MSRIAVRLDRVALRVPVPTPHRHFDLSRLNDEQQDHLVRLNERIVAVGPDGLTPDEMMEAAELLAILEGDPAP